jgi:thiamine pyrophosphate-dependent acetolactate synthase large subunit-like protein
MVTILRRLYAIALTGPPKLSIIALTNDLSKAETEESTPGKPDREAWGND